MMLQVGFLYYLERQIKGDVQAANTPQAPVIIKTSVRVPDTGVKNLQASFNKDYLAYSDSQGFKVLKVKNGQVVFQENKPPKGDILIFSWLPDRNTLLFVTAKPNSASKTSTVTTKPQTPKQTETQPQPTVKEDPQSKTPAPPPVTRTPNSQITELYAVDLADPAEEAQPDRKLGRRLDDFPAGATVQSIKVSTYTNLIYLLVQTANSQTVYEIDVMMDVRKVHRAGEKISRIVASDKKGTLYLQSTLNGVYQIVAVRHSGREQVLQGHQNILLGVDSGKLLVGQVENGELTKILGLNDLGLEDKNVGKTDTVWSGRIPWKNWDSITVANNFLAFSDGKRVVILDQGKERSVTLHGTDNYLTSDGRESIEVNSNGDGTVQVDFNPL